MVSQTVCLSWGREWQISGVVSWLQWETCPRTSNKGKVEPGEVTSRIGRVNSELKRVFKSYYSVIYVTHTHRMSCMTESGGLHKKGSPSFSIYVLSTYYLFQTLLWNLLLIQVLSKEFRSEESGRGSDLHHFRINIAGKHFS